MKRLLIASLAALAVAGCNSEIDGSEMIVRNGLIYKYGDKDPFTGVVLNSPMPIVPGIEALCNYSVEEGLHSGKSACLYNSKPVYEVEHLAGKKDGVETVYDVKTGYKKVVRHWKDNLQDGLEENFADGILVSKKEYKAGRQDGDSTSWSLDGKTITSEVLWRDGIPYTGFIDDGYQRTTLLEGKKHGLQIKYGYKGEGGQGKYSEFEEIYNHGQLDGVQKYFVYVRATDAVLQKSEAIYENGRGVSGWHKIISTKDGTVLSEFNLVAQLESEKSSGLSYYPVGMAPDGLIKTFYYDTNLPIGEELWVDGRKVKETQLYEKWSGGYETKYYINYPSGDIYHEEREEVTQEQYDSYVSGSVKTGVDVGSTAENAVSSEHCVEGWIKAYREDVGEDAMIVAEQLSEW